MTYIVLWLESPLQSWGVESRFGRRESLNFPTKSGVMGIICASLGAGGEQCDLLSRFSKLDIEAISYQLMSDDKPIPKAPLLEDFQMVGSGYDLQDPWEALMVPKKSDGKNAVGGGTKLTYRYYLQDAAFAVLLEVPDDMSDEIASALISPTWSISLGRKCCVPSELVYQGTFADIEEARLHADEIAKLKSRKALFRVIQGVADEGDAITINDVPVRFGDSKLYQERQVTIIME